MDKKDFEKLKAEEKEHLRKIRELKRKLKGAQTTLKAKEALREIQDATDTSELDAAMEALSDEALDAEVRLDMAMESAGEQQVVDPELNPEELQAKKADDLVAQMKAALLPQESRRKTESTEQSDATDGTTDALPEKTIGRMSTDEEPEGEPLPEKTIGRMSAPTRDQDSSAE